MSSYDKTLKLMNDYGKNKIPFLFIIDFELKSPLVFKLDEIDNSKIIYKINGTGNDNNQISINKKLEFEKYPVSYPEYKKAFDKVIKNIKAGNTYLLNLTFPTKIKTNYTLKEIFYKSNAKYKLFYDDKFVVFSPETFIKISGNKIFSFPMKGTIDAALENAENIILNDTKEQAEHYTIVDLIRNDLSIVAENVKVEEFRYIDKIKTNNKELLQVSSRISGELEKDFASHLGEIIFKLLPAGSISGAPKTKTVEIIKDAENYSRGFYTGIFGYFNGTDLDSGVMIRFIEKQGNSFIFKSGGGITSLSDPEKEYHELIDKVYVPFI